MDSFPRMRRVLSAELSKRKLKLLGSFVPVPLSDPASAKVVVEQIRKVGGLLSSLGAPFLVLADAQSEERDRIAGRVPADGSKGLNAEQWKQVAKVVAEAAQVTEEFGLDLVFHPHVSTYVETAAETEKFFDVTSAPKSGCAWIRDTVTTLETIASRKRKSIATSCASFTSRMSIRRCSRKRERRK